MVLSFQVHDASELSSVNTMKDDLKFLGESN